METAPAGEDAPCPAPPVGSILLLAISVAIAALLASPAGASVCGGCVEGSGHQLIAGLGAVVVAAAIALLSFGRTRMVGVGLLLLIAAAHAGLILRRPAEACTLCWVAFSEEAIALLALPGAAILRPAPPRRGWAPRVVGSGLLLAAAGFFGGSQALILVLGPPPAQALPTGEDLRRVAERTLSPSGGHESVLRLIVLLQHDCPHCRLYMESAHDALLENLPAGVQVQTLYDRVPGEYLRPRAYPAFLFVHSGSGDELWRLEAIVDSHPIIATARRLADALARSDESVESQR